MKQTLAGIILLAAALPVAGVSQARSAGDFFQEAPAAVFPYLSQSARMDMVAYARNGNSTESQNMFGGKSRITLDEPSRMKVRLSDNSEVTVALLAGKSDTIAAVIETVRTPVADSHITFYRTGTWQALEGVSMPGAEFFAEKKDLKGSDADFPPFLFLEADYDPSASMFTFVNHTAEYYADGEAPAGLKLMKDSVALRFAGGKWRRP